MGSGEKDRNIGRSRESTEEAQRVVQKRRETADPQFQEILTALTPLLTQPVVNAAQGLALAGALQQGAVARQGGGADAQLQADRATSNREAATGLDTAQQNTNLLLTEIAPAFLATLQGQQQLPLGQAGIFTQGSDINVQNALAQQGDPQGLGRGIGTLGATIFDLINRREEPGQQFVEFIDLFES